MTRDSKGRFAKANRENDLIRRMDMSIKEKNVRNIPVVDKRPKTAYINSAAINPYKNGCVYKIKDDELVKKAVENINSQKLGSLEHNNRNECKNCSSSNKRNVPLTRFANKKPISLYGNMTRGADACGSLIDEFNLNYTLSFTDTKIANHEYLLMTLTVKDNTTLQPFEYLNMLKKFDYFTVDFMVYDDNGYGTSLTVVDGFKLCNVSYSSENKTYVLAMKKSI